MINAVLREKEQLIQRDPQHANIPTLDEIGGSKI
jgi:hypothetical protein